MSSNSNLVPPTRDDSIGSIPSLHPAHPLRQDSIASTAAGRDAKEALQKQFQEATVCEEWEGTLLPENWEDKKEDDDAFARKAEANDAHKPVLLSRKKVARPVMMRHASASEYDEEGMEVAAVDEDDTQEEEEVVVEAKAADPADFSQAERSKTGLVVPRHQSATSSQDTELRQNSYRRFPNSLISFGVNSSKREGRLIDACASFDESKSVDRFRGVFRGVLPRSLSEDELPVLLSGHCSK
jgi:hypothetical protein